MLRRSFLKFLAWLPMLPLFGMPARGRSLTSTRLLGAPICMPKSLVVQEYGFGFPVNDEVMETTPPKIEIAVSEWGFKPDPIQPKWEDVFGVEPRR